MKSSQLLLICAVVYAAPHLSAGSGWFGFIACVAGYFLFAVKGK